MFIIYVHHIICECPGENTGVSTGIRGMEQKEGSIHEGLLGALCDDPIG